MASKQPLKTLTGLFFVVCYFSLFRFKALHSKGNVVLIDPPPPEITYHSK